jgi:oxidase EvaA
VTEALFRIAEKGPQSEAVQGFVERLESSVVAGEGVVSTEDFGNWWQERHSTLRFAVHEVPLADLRGWGIESGSGSIVHDSGGFFRVEGVAVTGTENWTRPIINQPEIGVLGIVVKEFGGVLHCLMQAKAEPGNVNKLQLSPTVQATRSNYTRVHRGGRTRYLEYFRGESRGRVVVDVLQSEQGGWFWRKQNRNMVVVAEDDVPEHEDFRWLTVGQVLRSLRHENFVNMDARSVLACLPIGDLSAPAGPPSDPFTRALIRSYEPGRDGASSFGEVLSWLTEAKTRCEWSTRLIPLGEVTGWTISGTDLSDVDGRDFRVVGVDVEVTNREVARWSQPLIAPRGHGLAVFLAKPIDGVLHVLIQARPEPGLRDLVEMAPTVQLEPRVDAVAAVTDEPFLQQAMTMDAAKVRFDSVMSEEGGRFYHAQTRYRIVEVDDEFPVQVPPNYCWITVRQLMELVRHGHYLNVEARSLLASVHGLW